MPIRQYAASRIATARSASCASAGPSKSTVKWSPSLRPKRAVQRRLLAPRLEPLHDLRVIGGVLERLLIRVDRAVDVAGLIEHRAEQQRRGGQRRIHLQRVQQETPRVVLTRLQVRRHACTKEQRRLLRRELQRLVERRDGVLDAAGIERVPSRARQLGGGFPLGERRRRGQEDQQQRQDWTHASILPVWRPDLASGFDSVATSALSAFPHGSLTTSAPSIRHHAAMSTRTRGTALALSVTLCQCRLCQRAEDTSFGPAHRSSSTRLADVQLPRGTDTMVGVLGRQVLRGSLEAYYRGSTRIAFEGFNGRQRRA